LKYKLFIFIDSLLFMEFEKVIKERFSIRKFKNEKVSDELITKILQAGNLAPTAKNYQPQRIYRK